MWAPPLTPQHPLFSSGFTWPHWKLAYTHGPSVSTRHTGMNRDCPRDRGANPHMGPVAPGRCKPGEPGAATALLEAGGPHSAANAPYLHSASSSEPHGDKHTTGHGSHFDHIQDSGNSSISMIQFT